MVHFYTVLCAETLQPISVLLHMKGNIYEASHGNINPHSQALMARLSNEVRMRNSCHILSLKAKRSFIHEDSDRMMIFQHGTSFYMYT